LQKYNDVKIQLAASSNAIHNSHIKTNKAEEIMNKCFMSSEVDRHLNEQEMWEKRYSQIQTEVEMEFLSTGAAQEILMEYVLDAPGRGYEITGGSYLDLANSDVSPENFKSNELMAALLMGGNAAEIARQELGNRIIKKAYEHGHIDRIVQNKM
jgi:hypothetical protein